MLSYLRSTTKEVEEDGNKKNVYDCAVTKDVYALSNGGEMLEARLFLLISIL